MSLGKGLCEIQVRLLGVSRPEQMGTCVTLRAVVYVFRKLRICVPGSHFVVFY